MKKFFTGVALVAMLFTVGATTTSCDEETIGQIIPLLQQLLGGKEQTFTGSMVASGIINIKEGTGDAVTDKDVIMENNSVSLKVAGQEAELTINEIVVGDIKIQNLVISGIPYDAGSFSTVQKEVVDGEEVEVQYGALISCVHSTFGQVETVMSETADNSAYTQAVVKSGVVTENGQIKFSIRLIINDQQFMLDYLGNLAQK